ncbi:unnamed protein product, partial [Arabis nemorensis]
TFLEQTANSADPSDRRPPGLTEEAIYESDAASDSRINSPSPRPPGLTGRPYTNLMLPLIQG